MAAGFKGMDTDEVRRVAIKFGTKASEIENIIKEVDRLVDSDVANAWRGSDADKFRSEWKGTHKTQLKKAANALNTAKSKAQSNAAKQDQTSSTY